MDCMIRQKEQKQNVETNRRQNRNRNRRSTRTRNRTSGTGGQLSFPFGIQAGDVERFPRLIASDYSRVSVPPNPRVVFWSNVRATYHCARIYTSTHTHTHTHTLLYVYPTGDSVQRQRKPGHYQPGSVPEWWVCIQTKSPLVGVYKHTHRLIYDAVHKVCR